MALKCESKHPNIAWGFGSKQAMGVGQAGMNADVPGAEREATDDAHEQAMAFLEAGGCDCEKPCERRFAISFGPTTLGKPEKFRANGVIIWRASVMVVWHLDVECKRHQPGAGIPKAKPV